MCRAEVEGTWLETIINQKLVTSRSWDIDGHLESWHLDVLRGRDWEGRQTGDPCPKGVSLRLGGGRQASDCRDQWLSLGPPSPGLVVSL